MFIRPSRFQILGLVALGILMMPHAAGQTFLNYRTVVNSASLMPSGLPGGAIAQGSIFSVSGRNIGPAAPPALTDPPSTTLGGVSIAITQGSTTVAAIPILVSPTQVSAIMPTNAPLGGASMRLTYNNGRSNPMPVQIVAAQFGIFTANGFGFGPANAQIVADDGTLTPITLQTPVMPGQNVAMPGTGLGVTALNDLSVVVGGVAATVLQTGPVTGSPGQDLITFSIPAAVPFGCWVPLYVKTGATAVSNFATLAISVDGTPCAEPNNMLASALVNGGNIGNYMTARVSVRHDAGVLTPRDAITDLMGAYQASEVAGPNNFNPVFSLPPAGSCTAYSLKGDFYGISTGVSADLANTLANLLPGVTPPTGAALDGGDVALAGSRSSVTAINSPYPGGGANHLGGAIPSLPLANQTFLDTGSVTLNVAGGNDIGQSSTDAPVPPPFTWTNRDQILNIPRSKGLTINWTGGDPNASVVIAGGNLDIPTNSAFSFVCVAPQGVNTFAVPADVLANVPVSRALATQSLGAVYVIQMNLATPLGMTTTGLDFASLIPAFVSGKTVTFQ